MTNLKKLPKFQNKALAHAALVAIGFTDARPWLDYTLHRGKGNKYEVQACVLTDCQGAMSLMDGSAADPAVTAEAERLAKVTGGDVSVFDLASGVATTIAAPAKVKPARALKITEAKIAADKVADMVPADMLDRCRAESRIAAEGKRAKAIELAKRPCGVTAGELYAATGWGHMSIPAMFRRLAREAGLAYRIVDGATAEGRKVKAHQLAAA